MMSQYKLVTAWYKCALTSLWGCPYPVYKTTYYFYIARNNSRTMYVKFSQLATCLVIKKVYKYFIVCQNELLHCGWHNGHIATQLIGQYCVLVRK